MFVARARCRAEGPPLPSGCAPLPPIHSPHHHLRLLAQAKYTASLSTRSVLDRQADWVRSRDDKLRRLALEAEERARTECTFHPSISDVSRAHPGRLPADVRSALHSPSAQQQQQQQQQGLHGSEPGATALARKSATEAAFVERMRRAHLQREEVAALMDEKVGLRADVAKARARQRPAAPRGAAAAATPSLSSAEAAAEAAAAAAAAAAASAAAVAAGAAPPSALASPQRAPAPAPTPARQQAAAAPLPPSALSPLSSSKAAASTLRSAILAGLYASQQRLSPQQQQPPPYHPQQPPLYYSHTAADAAAAFPPLELRPSRQPAEGGSDGSSSGGSGSSSAGLRIYSSPPPVPSAAGAARAAAAPFSSDRSLYAVAPGAEGGGGPALSFGPSVPILQQQPVKWVLRSGGAAAGGRGGALP